MKTKLNIKANAILIRSFIANGNFRNAKRACGQRAIEGGKRACKRNTR